MAVVIRPAGPDDVAAVTRVINAAFQVESFFKRGDRTSVDAVSTLLSSGVILVTDDAEDGVIASACIQITGNRIYIGMVSVDPARQRQGLGRALMIAAEEHGRSQGCTVADINVVNLRTELPPFYRRLGYVETGTRPFGDDQSATLPCHLVTMSKQIQAQRETS